MADNIQTIINLRSGPDESWDFTNHGQCVGCGKCCGSFLPLTQDDITRIKAHVHAHNLKPIIHAPVFTAAQDETCPFMDPSRPPGRRCVIYPIRPAMCRIYTCHSLTDKQTAARQNQLIMQDRGLREILFSLDKHAQNLRKTFWPELFPDETDAQIRL